MILVRDINFAKSHFFIVHELIMFRRSKNYHAKSIVLNVLGALRVIPGGNQVDGLPPASSVLFDHSE